MQVKVHHAQAGGGIHDLPTGESFVIQVVPLVTVEGIILGNEIMCRKQEATGATGGVTDGLTRGRAHDIQHSLDERAGGEVLPGTALRVLGVLFQQALVNFTLDVNIQADPGLAIDQLHQAFQLGGVLDLVLRFAEDDRDEP